MPETKLLFGRAGESLWSNDRESKDTYGLLSFDKDYARLGRLQVFNYLRFVEDDIIDDQLVWEHPAGTFGGIQIFQDRLWAQDAVLNTAYLRFDYSAIPNLNVTNKVKYEINAQRGTNFARPLRAGRRPEELQDSSFLGLINKGDYSWWVGDVKVHPKFRSMYRRRTAFVKGEPDLHNLTEMGLLTLRMQPMPRLWLEVGTELAKFFDFEDDSKDFFGSVVAGQMSLTNDYQGYEIIMNLGYQWERRAFEIQTETTTNAFIVVMVGLGTE